MPAFHCRVRNGSGWDHWAKDTGLQINLSLLCLPDPFFSSLSIRLPCSLLRFCDSLPSLFREENTDIHVARSMGGSTHSHFHYAFLLLLSLGYFLHLICSSQSEFSIARLKALLPLHLQPIYVVVSHVPIGKIHLGTDLALRCFQRLFLPHLATRPCSGQNNRFTSGASDPVLSY